MNNIFYTLLCCLVFGGIQAQDIRFSFVVDNTTPNNARKIDIFAESVGADENLASYQTIFYYDSGESTFSSFDSSPAAALGWSVAGGETQDNSAGTNGGVAITHDMKLTLGLIDLNVVGTTISGTPVKIGSIIFDNTPGNATAGSDIFMSNVALDPGLNYSGTDFVGHDVNIVGQQSQNLPLDLITFDVAKHDELSSLLTWTTEMEEDFSHFNIQRSFDALNWRPVADVKGSGTNTVQTNAYDFIDNQIPFISKDQSTVYYRLKMIDLDGQFEYSQIQSVEFELRNDVVNVYPNPSADFITINADTDINDVTIFNIDGKIVLQQKFTGRIDISSYDAGMYKVIVNTQTGSTTKTVVKID